MIKVNYVSNEREQVTIDVVSKHKKTTQTKRKKYRKWGYELMIYSYRETHKEAEFQNVRTEQ